MPLTIELTRSGLTESTHLVHVAVADANGSLFASSGNPTRVSYWRSSAKPFQALPLVQDGAADHFGFGNEELALCCASHSSEPEHLAAVERMLARIGCSESDLACGPHPPINAEVAAKVVREGIQLSPRWSNCSGKHTGMLALARHHGWPTADYQRPEHPVQRRIISEVSRHSGLREQELHLGVDGCTAVCFALPLAAMARAYASFSTSTAAAEERLREAMWSFPHRVAGRGRLCTELMEVCRGEVLAKVGAEGVYGAALPRLGLGIALKVEDGDPASSPASLLSVLKQVLARRDPSRLEQLAQARLASFAEVPITNTRGVNVGVRRAVGELTFR
jgi:L-asparaginase II